MGMVPGLKFKVYCLRPSKTGLLIIHEYLISLIRTQRRPSYAYESALQILQTDVVPVRGLPVKFVNRRRYAYESPP